MRVLFFAQFRSNVKSFCHRLSPHALLLLAILLVAIMKFRPGAVHVSNNSNTGMESVEQASPDDGTNDSESAVRFSVSRTDH
jgi:hypothetical protein